MAKSLNLLNVLRLLFMFSPHGLGHTSNSLPIQINKSFNKFFTNFCYIRFSLIKFWFGWLFYRWICSKQVLIIYNMTSIVDFGRFEIYQSNSDHTFHQTAFFYCFFFFAITYYVLFFAIISFVLLSLSIFIVATSHRILITVQQFFVSFAFFALLSSLFLIFPPQFLQLFLIWNKFST